MKVLLVGSGGREHAIAWKLAQSPKLTKLFIAPGNPGMASCGENIPLKVDDQAGIVRFCKENAIDLVVVGPEGPLAVGLADAVSAAGIRCFGPSQKAAEIESSKAFAKQFMARHDIPTARFATFTQYDEAIKHLHRVGYPVVIKASGLAAGKGVLLPADSAEAELALRQVMITREFGDAGESVVIEERMSGPEVSLLSFSDGTTVRPMIPSQDHKRIFDGDQGPNTGGMGAYAPVPVCPPELVAELTRTILQPAVDGMRAEGRPFVGVLYAGLMLTDDGPRVIEFNCRFGDPETQVVLPLLESDLLEVFLACVEGRLADTDLRWKSGAAACVVLASKGYPEKPETGKPVSFQALPAETVCFHAGTKAGPDGQVLTSGGRVFGVTAWASDLAGAVTKAYAAVEKVNFEGKHYRHDIAHRALTPKSAYESSGVSIDAGNRAVDLMKDAVKATYTPAVLAGIGSFGGLFDASSLKSMSNPVLVASTDGVGTKVKLAAAAGRYRGIGHDIVNHCIDDILVQGARPLFFMDYFATSKLNPEQTAEVVTGIAEACKESGMALLGGETAEMPGVYAPGEFDVAGTIIGVLERERILPRTSELQAGDVLIGLRSSGPHTNGYSLIRRVFADVPLDTVFPELGISLADALLPSHRAYLNLLTPLLSQTSHIKALAHLTGGGFIENIPRVLPDDLDAVVQIGSWPVPALWNLIQQRGNIAVEEMYRVFNMGIGMVLVVDANDVAAVQGMIAEETYVLGILAPGSRKTRLVV